MKIANKLSIYMVYLITLRGIVIVIAKNLHVAFVTLIQAFVLLQQLPDFGM